MCRKCCAEDILSKISLRKWTLCSWRKKKSSECRRRCLPGKCQIYERYERREACGKPWASFFNAKDFVTRAKKWVRKNLTHLHNSPFEVAEHLERKFFLLIYYELFLILSRLLIAKEVWTVFEFLKDIPVKVVFKPTWKPRVLRASRSHSLLDVSLCQSQPQRNVPKGKQKRAEDSVRSFFVDDILSMSFFRLFQEQ